MCIVNDETRDVSIACHVLLQLFSLSQFSCSWTGENRVRAERKSTGFCGNMLNISSYFSVVLKTARLLNETTVICLYPSSAEGTDSRGGLCISVFVVLAATNEA